MSGFLSSPVGTIRSALLPRAGARHRAMVPALLLAALLAPLLWRRPTPSAAARVREQALIDALLPHCPDVIWLKDTDGVYQACNRTAATLLGIDQRELIGKSDHELFPPDLARRHLRSDRAVLASGEGLVEEQTMPSRADGHEVTLDVVKTAVRKKDGTIVGILGVARDVTARRREEQRTREQHALLEEMSSLAEIGGWEIDVAKATFCATAELARIHELASDPPLTLEQCLAHYDGADRQRIAQAIDETVHTGTPNALEVALNLPSGARKWVRAHWRSTVLDGKVTRVWGMVQDLTELRRQDASRRMAELIYRTSPDAIVISDGDNLIVDANPAFEHLMGYRREDVLGMSPRALVAGEHEAEALDAIPRTLATQDTWEGDLCCRRKNGSTIDVHVAIHLMRDNNGEAPPRAIHITDLTERIARDRQIWTRNNFDTLTGLPNRSLFLDRLGQELKKPRSSEQVLGVLYVDLDHLQEVNQVTGHAAGDRVLIETATRLQRATPPDATIARLGGDRFALYLDGGGSRAHLELSAQDLVETLSAPLAPEAGADPASGPCYMSASIGVAICPDDSHDANDLVRAAEQASAHAKRQGGNRFQYFTPTLHRAALAKVRLTNDLRHALARAQLQMVYQPIVDIASGRIHKAEALLRWNHPVHGSVSPARFIPLAEESGLIIAIGDWVMEQAIASVLRWRNVFHTVIELSVNNSPAQFEQDNSCDWIERLVQAGLPPHSITVEITEGLLIRDSDRVRDCLRRLQASGTKVSLDDFGTGFSALSYLKRFDVDYLKIDKSFIKNLARDPNDETLTQAIIDLAHKLDIETIAEGVETTAQRDILRRFGCDYLQGFLYSPAVPRDAFESLLEQQAG